MIKKCTKCGKEYPAILKYFSPNKKCKDGLQSCCRECAYTVTADWRKKNPEYNKKYCKEYHKKHYQENKEKLYEYQKEYRKTFRGHVTHLVGNIKSRCTNSKTIGYKYWGGRGIKCLFTSDELYDWLITNNIEPRGLEIHRINNNENYTLDNIGFFTKKKHLKLHSSKEVKK